MLLFGAMFGTMAFFAIANAFDTRKARKELPPAWEVIVVPAVRKARYDYSEDQRVEGEMAVRVKRGKDHQTIGTAKIIDDDFDEQINALVRKAEERAATLNAVYSEVYR
jgi:hypothetical protein